MRLTVTALTEHVNQIGVCDRSRRAFFASFAKISSSNAARKKMKTNGGRGQIDKSSIACEKKGFAHRFLSLSNTMLSYHTDDSE